MGTRTLGAGAGETGPFRTRDPGTGGTEGSLVSLEDFQTQMAGGDLSSGSFFYGEALIPFWGESPCSEPGTPNNQKEMVVPIWQLKSFT